jgi:hypothetical protein
MMSGESLQELYAALQGLTPERIRAAEKSVMALKKLGVEQRPFTAPTWEVVQALGTLRRLLIDLNQSHAP